MHSDMLVEMIAKMVDQKEPVRSERIASDSRAAACITFICIMQRCFLRPWFSMYGTNVIDFRFFVRLLLVTG